MKILVIGGAGYIGSHTVLAFLEEGFSVTVYDNLSTGCKENLFPGVAFVKGDILDEKKLLNTLKKGFQAVVHLAALKAAGDSMLKPAEYATHNICGTINILNSCLKAGIRYFIFSSSAAIFGNPQYLPVDENHPRKPINFYGYTKLNIEQLLEWYDRIKGLRYLALRYFNAAGYDPKLRVKGIEKNPTNLVPVIMENLIGKRKFFEIFGTDYQTRDGTAIRDYVHATDLAKAHVKGLQRLLTGSESLGLNLGSEKGVTVLEMLEAAQRISGKKIEALKAARRMGDPQSLIASSEKAKKVLNWQPNYSDLETILKTTWEVYCHVFSVN